jgi:muconolactone delta-isomerase
VFSAGLCRVRAAEQKGAGIRRRVGAPGWVQTLKVFSADSGDCLQDCLASHDDGSRWKPLGSRAFDNPNLFLRQPIQLIHQTVNLGLQRAGIRRGVGALGGTQTLKVFSADSGDCLQDCLASHDDGSRGKPLGSCSYALCLSRNQIILQNWPQAPRWETCGHVFGGDLP